MRSVAGHTFPDFGPCSCGIHWTSIRNVTATDLNQPGIAHTGNLTSGELAAIEVARAEEDARIEAAMGEVNA